MSRTYDPAFIEWWNQQTLSAKAALAVPTIEHCANAWEAAVRLVKKDCADMHSQDIETINKLQEQVNAPIDVLLACPRCDKLHVDAPEPEKGWTNPPHKSHLCHFCGTIWRPADVPTNGVAEIKTRGERDTWPPSDVTDDWGVPIKPSCFD